MKSLKFAKKKQGGQALIELVVSLSLASIVLTSVVLTMISAREGLSRAEKNLEASLLLTSISEAVKSIKETSWSSLVPGNNYYPQIVSDAWVATAGTTNLGQFSYYFNVANVCRLSSTTPVVDCASANAKLDPSTKKITSSVNWVGIGTNSLTDVFYITRYNGNSTWSQTNVVDFNSGIRVGTQVTNNSGGEVELADTVSTSDYGNTFLVTVTSSIGAMTSINHKTALRFSAQESKTVTAVRVYLEAENGTSPSYRYGIQANAAGDFPSGSFLGSGSLTATSPGWKTISLSPSVNLVSGSTYHLVIEPVGSPTGSRNIALRRSTPLNNLYLKTNTVDSQAKTLLKTTATGAWTVQNFQPIYELDFSDGSFEGNPTESSSEISVFGSNFYGERFSFSGANKQASAISFYVRRNGNPANNLSVVLWDSTNNVLVEEGVLATPILATTYSYQTYTFSSPKTLISGRSYRIYLKSVGATNTNSYRVYRLNTTAAANFNSITYDGTSSLYTLSTNSGGSWTDTSNWDIAGFKFTIQTTGLGTNGTFESQSYDAGSQVSFNYLEANLTKPAGTNLRLQVATNNDNATWNYLGPDGTTASFFEPAAALDLTQINARYFRFKAFFTGDGVATPILFDVKVNYSP